MSLQPKAVWEVYSQDDNIVTIGFYHEGDYRLDCTCGWRGRAKGEGSANSEGMDHVLEHDKEAEEAYNA